MSGLEDVRFHCATAALGFCCSASGIGLLLLVVLGGQGAAWEQLLFAGSGFVAVGVGAFQLSDAFRGLRQLRRREQVGS